MAKKFLIIKIGAIGDVVMALPMLTFIRTQERDAHITWVCGKAAAPILQAIGLVDELVVINEKDLFLGSPFQKAGVVWKTWKALGGRFFDGIFIAQADSRYRLMTLFCRAKKIRSFRKKGREFFIPGRYHSHEYVRLITGIDAANTSTASLPPWTQPLPSTYQQFFMRLQHKKVVALAPGGAKNVMADDAMRRWPIENYVALATMLLDAGFEVALTGGETDRWAEEYFEGLSVHNFIGKTTLSELVSFYQNCHLIITHDCGPLHLAKLAATPQIALFGPTNPSEKTSSMEKTEILWGGENLSCRPCYNGKTFAACADYRCMKSITPKRVMSAVHAIL